PPLTTLCPSRRLRLRLTVSLALTSRCPPLFQTISRVGGVTLPQNMPLLDLAMRSLLVRVLSSTNRTHNLTLSAGQSLQQLQKEFADIRNTFHSRYVRLYGACDRDGFYDDVIDAAWDNTLGVHA